MATERENQIAAGVIKGTDILCNGYVCNSRPMKLEEMRKNFACTICGKMGNNIVLDCGHKFHNDCITTYFTEKGSSKCPVCGKISATVSDVKLGGYEKKYLKYKQKYLQLKNSLN